MMLDVTGLSISIAWLLGEGSFPLFQEKIIKL